MITPYKSAYMERYDHSLGFVFQNENKELKSIANAGSYALGKKSRVKKSYEEKYKDLSLNYISLDILKGFTEKLPNRIAT